jgi:hypothetical protein
MNKIMMALAFAILMIILGPIATIWAMNTLFPSLNIPTNFDTWCAIVVLSAVLKSNYTYNK